MPKIAELRAMYNQPPPTASKPTSTSRWGQSAASNNSSNNKSFLHGNANSNSPSWSPKPTKNEEPYRKTGPNNSSGFQKSSWDQKQPANEFQRAIRNFANTGNEGEINEKPNVTSRANNEIKKTPSFQSQINKPTLPHKPGSSAASEESSIPSWKKPTPPHKPGSSAASEESSTPSWKKPTPPHKPGSSAASEESSTPSWKKPTPPHKPGSSAASGESSTPSWKKPTPPHKPGSSTPAQESSTPSWVKSQQVEKAEPPVKNAFPPKPSMPSKPTHTFSKPSFGSHQNENQDDQEDKRNIASSLFLDQARKPREASFSPPPNSAAPRGKLRENYSLVSKNFTENLTTSSPELHKQTKPTDSDRRGNIPARERRKRALPPSVYNRNPPEKPRKPLNARLPGEDTHRQGNDLPPPLPAPMLNERKGAPPVLPFKPQSTRPTFSPFNTNKAYPSVSSLPERHLSPGGSNNFPIPISPAKPRTLPTLPGSGNSQIPNSPPTPDDVYDDTVPPPLSMDTHPTAAASQSNDNAIPTWDDEDEDFYDETAVDQGDEGALPPPPIPIEEEGDDMYEDLDQYQKFKLRTTAPGPGTGSQAPVLPPPILSKKDEKKRKEMDKKEKEIRKKFQLPIEGEIAVEGCGTVKNDVKGFNKQTLHANDKVDIIRMNNNPKGKILIRTQNQSYSYVDQNSIYIDLYSLRAAPSQPGLPKQFPPPLPSSSHPGGEVEEEEGVYDETPSGKVMSIAEP